MEHSSFDPKKAVTFDLPNGQVRLGQASSEGSDNDRSVIVPAGALAALVTAAGEVAAHDLGRALGRTLGARVRERLDGEAHVREASVERVAAELAAELAIVGLGTLSFERWGRALCVLVSGAPGEGRAMEMLLGTVVESMMSAATGRDVRTTPIARDRGVVRFLVGNVASIERVVGWMSEGVAWGDALTRLHAPREHAA